MTARSVGMVDPAQYMNGTLDSGQKNKVYPAFFKYFLLRREGQR